MSTPSNITLSDRNDKSFMKAREEFAKARYKGLVVKRRIQKEVLVKTKVTVTEFVFVPDGKSWKDPELTGHVASKDSAKVKNAKLSNLGSATDGKILLGTAK